MESVDIIIKKIDKNIEEFGLKYPGSSSTNLKYPLVENTEWTTSFWTGMLWLAYDLTKDEKYSSLAKKHSLDFENRIDNEIETDTHDLGFLYSLSCVADYKITKDSKAKEIALKAADKLVSRYSEKAEIIQAWGDLNNPKQQGRMIIDCNLNLPLLYWASSVTGNDEYKEKAYKHAKKAQKYIVRDDYSTYHTYYFDVNTGEAKYGDTHQGYADNSCWTRGQTWGIYGFLLSYIHTKDESFLETSIELSKYFIKHMDKEDVLEFDFQSPLRPKIYDSSAMAIALTAFVDLVEYIEDEKFKNEVLEASNLIMKILEEKAFDKDVDKEGVLRLSTYNYNENLGINEFNIWGDYYYFEALCKMKNRDYKNYWL